MSVETDMAFKWLLDSGIQNINSDERTNGGFNSWYDASERRYPFVYSEITGYGITSLLLASSIIGDATALDRAKSAAKWLTSMSQDGSGGFRTRYMTPQVGNFAFQDSLVYTFDTGIILFGLLNLYNITNDDSLMNSAILAARFLKRSQNVDGTFRPVFDVSKNSYVEYGNKWSEQPGGFHSKIAMALVSMSSISGDRTYEIAARKICDWAVRGQKDDGRFATFSQMDDTHLHPHCYTAEGLVYAGAGLGDKKYIESATRAFEWAMSLQSKDGGVPFYFKSDGNNVPYERTDVLAQVLRLGCVLRGAGAIGNDFDNALGELKRKLCTFQVMGTNDVRREGGILFGTDFDGKSMHHVNSWCTMFSAQAISMFDRLFSGKEVGVELFI